MHDKIITINQLLMGSDFLKIIPQNKDIKRNAKILFS